MTFERRSFDLSELRAQSLERAPVSRVEPLISRYERLAREDQAPFVAAVEALGCRVIQRWWIVNACCIEVEPSVLEKIRALPNVLRVDPDETARPVLSRT